MVIEACGGDLCVLKLTRAFEVEPFGFQCNLCCVLTQHFSRQEGDCLEKASIYTQPIKFWRTINWKFISNLLFICVDRYFRVWFSGAQYVNGKIWCVAFHILLLSVLTSWLWLGGEGDCKDHYSVLSSVFVSSSFIGSHQRWASWVHFHCFIIFETVMRWFLKDKTNLLFTWNSQVSLQLWWMLLC